MLKKNTASGRRSELEVNYAAYVYYRRYCKMISNPDLTVYSISSRRWRILPVGDVQTSVSARWDGNHLKGDLRTNVWHWTMSWGRNRICSYERRSDVPGLLRGCTAASQCQMFWTAGLRDTNSGSVNGKDKSMLQTSGKISGSNTSLL